MLGFCFRIIRLYSSHMADMMQISSNRPRLDDVECVCEVRAQVASIGGVIVLALCLVLTVVAFMATQVIGITQSQQLILILLTFAAWLYFIDSSSERLHVNSEMILFHSLLAHRKQILINEIETMMLVEQGFNLEQGMQAIEFKRVGRRPERIVLGPCWQRNKLEKFLHSAELAMNEPQV